VKEKAKLSYIQGSSSNLVQLRNCWWWFQKSYKREEKKKKKWQ
jgi:hypothetical protein